VLAPTTAQTHFVSFIVTQDSVTAIVNEVMRSLEPLFALARDGALRGLTAVLTLLAALVGQTAAPLGRLRS
jgi:hypothetical protein